MALIIETGAGVPNANSYTTLAEAAAYHALYGNVDWDGAEEDLERALIVACRSLELLYGPKYLGMRLTNDQTLLFPRYSFYDNLKQLHNQNTIPARLKDAQAELALMYLAGGDLFPIENAASGIAQESIKVGEISTSTTYKKQANLPTYDGFRKIDITLYPLIKVDGPILAFSR